MQHSPLSLKRSRHGQRYFLYSPPPPLPLPPFSNQPNIGKITAQCSHATTACYKHFLAHSPSSPLFKCWESLGQAKIALRVASEEQMEPLYAQAVSLGLCAQVFQDAGKECKRFMRQLKISDTCSGFAVWDRSPLFVATVLFAHFVHFG